MSVHVPEQKLVCVLQLLGDFLKARDHRVRDIASVVGKLISLEPALGRSVLIGTRLATIAIVIATEVSEAAKKRANPWSKTIRVEDDTLRDIASVVGKLISLERCMTFGNSQRDGTAVQSAVGNRGLLYRRFYQ
jgi:hypothetical protein